MNIRGAAQELSPGAVIELFVIDLSRFGAPTVYMHAGTNRIDGDVIWQGIAYQRYPVAATGFEIKGQGPLPRPRLAVSNVTGVISALCRLYGDIVGGRIIRHRTLVRYLDAANFPAGNPDADPEAFFPDDLFFVNQKTKEDQVTVEFELAVAFDVQGVQLPRRQIIRNSCPWKYRGDGCGYAGGPVADANDNPTTDAARDVCGKRLTSCKMRFGVAGWLPFGAFPGSLGLSVRRYGMLTLDFTSVLPLIQVHADAEAPRECCGLVVRRADDTLAYMPCRNLARDADEFVIDPEDAAHAEDAGEIVAYAHSHVFVPPTPTDADRASMARTGLPWIIVNHPLGSFTINEPVPYLAPLIGRTFVHGVHDCYGIVRDWYALELGILLNDYPRYFGWWDSDDGPDLYRENFEREGFVVVHEGVLDAAALDSLRENDLLLMRIRARRDNHMAIYMGGNVILHHLVDQLSRREALQEFYQRRTTAVLRHRALLNKGGA